MRDEDADTKDLGFAETVAPDAPGGNEDTLAMDPGVDQDAALDATVASDAGTASSPPSGVTVPSKGDTLGRYLVVDSLGAGGMGVVYSGFDPELQRPVALKLIRPRPGVGAGTGTGTASGSLGAQARLMREAQAMAQLSHPNILTVYDVGTWGDQVYIAMELVQGVTLDRWLRAAPRTLPNILEVFIQAAQGLQAAHIADLIHRDFKPDNVLVDQEGRVRVMDFGLARYLADSADPADPSQSDRRSPSESPSESPSAQSGTSALLTPLTQAGALLGTPAYMSPEQFEGSTVDARSDQFSFGVALYEALYRQRPFTGKTLAELREAVINGRMEPPPRSRPASSWAHAVVTRSLLRDPDQRFATMGDLVSAITRGLRRRQRVAWAVGLILILVAAVGGVVTFQHRSARSEVGRQHALNQAKKKKAALIRAQKDRARLTRHLNLLRTRREALLKQLVTEKDELKRVSIGCQIAGLEDVLKQPGERITANEIRRALLRCLPVVKQCYLMTLKKHPKVAGTIKVRFLTDRNGRVTQVTFPVDTVREAMLTQCIYSTFIKWSFPTGGGDIDPIKVSYPFHFRPQK